jgi:HlyD family secretion protein
MMKWLTFRGVATGRKRLLAVGLLTVILSAGVGYGRRSPAVDSPKAKPGSARIAVKTVRPQRETLHRVIEQPGQIEGFERTSLYAKIPGFVRKYHFDIGDHVRQGQILAELWVPEVVEDLHQKEATVGEDEAVIVQAKELLRVADAKISQAGANVRWSEATRIKAEATRTWWKSEQKRVTRLLGRGASPPEEMEQADERYETAEAAVTETIAAVASSRAALSESKAERDMAAADVRVAEARLKVAQADRARAAAILGYSRIEAPYDGVVSRRFIDTGAYVQAPAGSKDNATPLFEVVRTDLVRIFVDVPEADAPSVRNGGPGRVQVQALGDREFLGRVARTSWLLDSRTRTLRTEIDLPNPEGRLRPGMYATARLPVERPHALTLPASAVFHQDDGDWVVRVDGSRAIWTPVRLALRAGQRVEVVRQQTRLSRAQDEAGTWEDFDGSSTIVIDSPSALVDGQEVQTQAGATP